MKPLIQEIHLVHSTDYVGSFKTDQEIFSIWWKRPGQFITRDQAGNLCDYFRINDLNKMLSVLGYEEIVKIPNRETLAV